MDTRRDKDLGSILQSIASHTLMSREGMLSRAPKKSWEKIPLRGSSDFPSESTWDYLSRCHREGARVINVLTSPRLAQAAHRQDPAGSQKAREPFDELQTGQPPRASWKCRKNGSKSEGINRGHRHWAATTTRRQSEAGKASWQERLSTWTKPSSFSSTAWENGEPEGS